MQGKFLFSEPDVAVFVSVFAPEVAADAKVFAAAGSPKEDPS